MAAGAAPIVILPGRTTTAKLLNRAGGNVALNPIAVGDTDAFQFDMTSWFPSGLVSGDVILASQPAGWVFSGKQVAGSVVTVYATAPAIAGFYTLLCSGTDGTSRMLTLEERILVVPGLASRTGNTSPGGQNSGGNPTAPSGQQGNDQDEPAFIVASRTAASSISGHRVLMFVSGGTAHADPSNVIAYVFAGISTEAAAAGQQVSIVEVGDISESSWNWTPGAALYVGLNGVLTQTPPAAGVLQQVATATSAISIAVLPQPPIIRS